MRKVFLNRSSRLTLLALLCLGGEACHTIPNKVHGWDTATPSGNHSTEVSSKACSASTECRTSVPNCASKYASFCLCPPANVLSISGDVSYCSTSNTGMPKLGKCLYQVDELNTTCVCIPGSVVLCPGATTSRTCNPQGTGWTSSC